MANFTVSIDGLDKVLKKMDAIAGQRMIGEIDKVTETYARKMANDSASLAPVDSGLLRNSIVASPKRVEGARGVWQWGSNLAYARRQEYEHRSRKAFIRSSIWMNQDAYRNAVKRKITEGGR